MRRPLLVCAVALVAVVASLLVAEAVLRRLAPTWTLLFPPVNMRPDLFEAASFGYRLKPNVVGRYRYSAAGGAATTIRANAEGFRGSRPIAEQDARPRLVVIGDSMVFGVGVEEEERFTELLEKRHPEWRVDNLGMVGFGTDLMLRVLQDVALPQRPRLVVLVLHSDDLRRVADPYAGMGFPLPKFFVQDGRLATKPYPEPWPWDRLRIVQGLKHLRSRLTGATFPLNEAILDRFHELAIIHGFGLVVAYAPPPHPAWHDGTRRRFLAGWARRSGVPFVDLSPSREGDLSVYLPGDSHWSPRGHEMVAARLAPLLHARPRSPTEEGA
ncbi:MAG: SGNH/GDSL hydrolase family protein [Thermodesulfobacteriota bacterium]